MRNTTRCILTLVLTALLGACSVTFTFIWRWSFVKLLCPAATYLIFFGWYQQYGDSRTGVALTGTAVFFLLFSLSAVLPYLVLRVKDRRDDAILALGNGLICFAFLFDILYDDHRTAMALTTFGLSVLFLAQFIKQERHRLGKIHGRIRRMGRDGNEHLAKIQLTGMQSPIFSTEDKGHSAGR